MTAPCSVAGCEVQRHAGGLCNRHYMVQKRHGDPLWTAPTLAERFWQRVAVGAPDECWEWTAGRFRHRGGYGRFMWQGRSLKAHRVALELATGSEPTGDVSHSCDNPPCCNPAHLRDASHAENMADMVVRDRSPRGVRNGHAVLTEEDVREIRRRATTGEIHRLIGADYGIGRQAVDFIVQRKRWGHVA